VRITPSLKNYITNEIDYLGYTLNEKRRSWILFLILNSISVLLIFLIELKVIYFNNTFLDLFFYSTLIFYLFISISIPILWRFYYDGLTVKLKRNYQVYLNPYYKVRKSKVKDYQLIRIFLTSNRIAFRFNKNKKTLFGKIARIRWLQVTRKPVISKYSLNPYLKFREFSTPSNFQKQFLNIVLALQEWEYQCKKKIAQ